MIEGPLSELGPGARSESSTYPGNPIVQLDSLNDQQLRTFRWIQAYPDGVNLPVLLSRVSKHRETDLTDPQERRALDSQLRRHLEELKKKDLITVEKQDGLLWSRARRFDLIREFSAKFQQDSQLRDKIYLIPRRCRAERRESAFLLLRTQMLSSVDSSRVQGLFGIYLQDINDRVIVLQSTAPIGDPSDFLGLEYSTRFNDKKKVKKSLARFDTIIKNSLRLYRFAVYLTLTSDPKMHSSLWVTNRHMGPALNKFMSFLQARFFNESPEREQALKEQKAGLISKRELREKLNQIRKHYRPVYHSEYEFTDSGLIHTHLLIFGRKYLIDHREITREWERCNQGSINYLYGLRNQDNHWIWARGKPKDARGYNTAEEYLKKYLVKGLFDQAELHMYWVMNKRFYSNTQSLNDKTNRKISTGFWTFLGSFHLDTFPTEDLKFLYRVDPTWYPVQPPPTFRALSSFAIQGAMR